MRYNDRIMGEGWLAQNWFVLLQSTGIIGGLVFTGWSLRIDARSRRVGNLLRITQQHREIWKNLLDRPELARVLRPETSPTQEPVNDQEAVFLTFLFLHLNSAFYAMRERQFLTPEGLRKDIQWFLSLPIPRAFWLTAKPYLDQGFVRFVEGCRDQSASD